MLVDVEICHFTANVCFTSYIMDDFGNDVLRRLKTNKKQFNIMMWAKSKSCSHLWVCSSSIHTYLMRSDLPVLLLAKLNGASSGKMMILVWSKTIFGQVLLHKCPLYGKAVAHCCIPLSWLWLVNIGGIYSLVLGFLDVHPPKYGAIGHRF